MRLVECLSSVWLGVAILALIFAYSAIGSALPAVRQHRWIELTESQWFTWWPFLVLVTALCINLIVATLRSIPWSWLNAGVWMAHCGILLLCAGSAVYFRAKLDGDTLVFRRCLRIGIPGVDGESHLVVRPENRMTLDGPDGQYSFQIHDIDPEWLPAGSPAGAATAYRVAVMVTTPHYRLIRHLVDRAVYDGRDEVLSGGRAVPAATPVGAGLRIELGYEPQEYFFVQHTSALYVRESGTMAWHDRPLDELPLYNDRLSLAEDVWTGPEAPPVLDPLEVPAPASSTDPLADVTTRVVGYLRSASEVQKWVDDGPVINPVIELEVTGPGLPPRRVTLQLNDPIAAVSPDGLVRGMWIESPQDLEDTVMRVGGVVVIQHAASGASLELPVAHEISDSPTAGFRELPGTPYACRVVEVFNRLAVRAAQEVSVAMVEVRTPEGLVARMVVDDPQYGEEQGDERLDLTMRYRSGTGPSMTLLAGPRTMPLTWVLRDDDGVRRVTDGYGATVTRSDGTTATVVGVHRRGHSVVRPEIVPRAQRDPAGGRSRAFICVALSTATWRTRVWLPFNNQVLPSAQYAIPQRIDYRTREVIFDDGRRIELMFSRQRRLFGERVALEDFKLLTHPGGFDGAPNTIRDFVSRLRFEHAGSSTWSPAVTMAANRPVRHRGWWLFQGAWDPPGRATKGMNFSGVGVGRRQGVHVQLAGAILVAIGAVYSFYVKPALLTRQGVNEITSEPQPDRAESVENAT